MKIAADINVAGYSAQLIQASTILRLGERGLALFLQDTAATNPCLHYTAPPDLLTLPPSDNMRADLHAQLGEFCSAAIRPLASLLIEQINDDGLMEWSADIEQTLIAEYGERQVQNALAAVHMLAPAGIGARTQRECLLLQLATHADSVDKTAAENIVQRHLSAFLRRRFDKLPRRHLSAALTILQSLSLCPGAKWIQTAASPPPDVELLLINGLWKARPGANSCAPFATRVGGTRGDYARARRIVTMVAARRRQLLKLTQWATDRQSAFLSGRGALSPLPMQTAAATLSISCGMVSHIVTDKYFLVGGRIYALKSLFARQTTDGIAAVVVHAHIHQIIANENPDAPVSDRHLQQQLRSDGIALSRRTVGKHRAAAGILRASMRKRVPEFYSTEKQHAN